MSDVNVKRTISSFRYKKSRFFKLMSTTFDRYFQSFDYRCVITVDLRELRFSDASL